MRATITLEFDSHADIAAFMARMAGGGDPFPGTTGETGQPGVVGEPQKRTRKTKDTPAAEKVTDADFTSAAPASSPASAAAPAPEPPATKPEPVAEAEPVTRAAVGAALRKFIKDKGDKGVPLALAMLKDNFGTTKFDEVKDEDLGKLLSKINQS